MMSKNSSWKAEKPNREHSSLDFVSQLRENGKRRLWLFALLSFVMLLCYPLTTALTLSRYGREEVSLVVWQGVGHDMLGIGSGITILLLTAGAVLCAVEGFSWIFSRQKTDMYLSQPITAGRRFLMVYINGILIYFLPYLLALFITVLVIAGAGAASAALFVNILFTLPAAFIYFLAVYDLVLIAMMISGRRGMAGFFILMSFLYEAILRVVLNDYAVTYFSTYAYRNPMERFVTPVFSMIETVEKSTFSWGAGRVAPADVLEHLVRPMLPGVLFLLAEAVLFGAIAYYCYKKRPMEAVSQAVAFPAVKGPVKVLLILLSGLIGSSCFCNIAGSDAFYVAVPGLLLGILFCQVVLEIVYESDLRAFMRHKRYFAAGAAVTVCTYLFFALDISGYDTWVPKPEQVESAAIEIYFDNHYQFKNVDEKDAITWSEQYGLETMELTDVSGVLSLAGDGMGKDAQEQNEDTQLRCSVKYKLKNGKEKYRDFYIDYEKEKTVLDILFANEEYKEGTNQILSPRMDRIFEKSRVYYDNGLQVTEIVDKNALALMRAYQEDIREMSFTDVKDAVPCGILELHYKTEKMEEYVLEYPVFPSYTETVEYLRGKNAALYLSVNPAAVESMTLKYYQENVDREIWERENFFGTDVSMVQVSDISETEYSKRSEVEELLRYLYPASLAGWSYTPNIFDQNIYVSVEGADRAEAYVYHWESTGFMVKRDELPKFVKQDLAGKRKNKSVEE